MLSIIVKLLMAASGDYDTFITLMLEEQMENEWDG
jgi:hypothetical protein